MPTFTNAADLKLLGCLLDQALKLAPDLTTQWLTHLPAHAQHLAPRLQRLLTDHHAGASAGLFASQPRLNDAQLDATAQPGDMAGPYRLLRELGRGGMCTVWLAERADLGTAQKFAVKLPRRLHSAGVAQRMAAEGEITALMDHPHVARLRDVGQTSDGRPYLVLDPICGQTLDNWCEQKELGVDDRLRLFLQVVRAVAYVHSRGVVHRDLKPANVLVNDDGQVHVLDFGIACQLSTEGRSEPTAIAERSLTPAYASPEQLRGAGNSFASDIYSLGVMLFELLTGQLPHVRKPSLLSAADALDCVGAAPLASSQVKDASTASRLRGPVDALLRKAMSPQPEQRHSSALALAEAIEQLLSRPIRARRLVGSNDSDFSPSRHSAAWRGAIGSPTRHNRATPINTHRGRAVNKEQPPCNAR
jgi:eukaryotic-like serine/threonine-protein kinase